MAELQDLPSVKSCLSLFNLTEDFFSACELVKDLPCGNGEDDWNNFEDLWQQVQSQTFEDVRNVIFEHASIELINSPLFEILFEIGPEVAPPKTFASATRIRKRPCVILDTDLLKHIEFGLHPLTAKFIGVLCSLHSKKVNVLDFLSTENTDTLLETCPLFRVLMHSISASASHALIKVHEVEPVLRCLRATQCFHSQGDYMYVPPYLPGERYGINYDYAQFLQCLQNAEAHIEQFQFLGPEDYGHPSFDILHCRLHEMVERVTVAEVMAGHEPSEGTPGAIIYNHLIDACNPELECILFFAKIAGNGDGEAFLQNAFQPLPQNPGVITQLEAMTLVDKLKKGRSRRHCARGHEVYALLG